MRILQINSVVNYGSTGKIVSQIGSVVKKQGWDSYIAFGRHLEVATSREYRIGSNLELLSNVVGSRIFDNQGFGLRRGTKKLLNYIVEIDPDIIHMHNLHGYYINIAELMPFLDSLGIPIVMTLHDCWSFTGHCSYFDFAKCTKWQTHCERCPQKRRYPASYLMDRSARNYDDKRQLFDSLDNLTLVAVSKWLDDLLLESFLSRKRHVIIRNGIDISTFTPRGNRQDVIRKYNISGNYIILGVANKWTGRKGIDDFLKIMKYLDKETMVVLVGEGLKRLSRRDSHLIVIEHTDSSEELASLYSAADLFVNPTYEDNLPTTIMEAMACGTPVLAYNTGGCPEMIDASTGMLVEKGNLEQLHDMIELFRKRGKESYSYSCRKKAEQYFNKDDRFMDYIKLYKDLINGDVAND
jgi:putative colanic acid biosynthesis glycosyltransferase